MANRRRSAVRLLLFVGGLCAGLSVVAGHLNRNLIDGPTFAEHVDALRRDEEVAAQVGESMARELIRANPDLVALAPLVEAVSVQVAGGDLLAGPVRAAAATAHRALTEPDADSVVLRIADAGAVIAAVLATVAPERAPAATDISVTLASIGDQAFASTTIAVAHLIGVLAWVLPLLAVACLAAAVVVSSDRLRTGARVGWSLLWSAIGVGLLLAIGAVLVRQLDTDTLGGAVGHAGWEIFIRPMWLEVVILGALGAIVALTFGSQVPGMLYAHGARVRSLLVRRPATALGVATRAVLAAAVGVAAIADPAGFVELAVVLLGAGLVIVAVTEVGSLVAPTVTSDAVGGEPVGASDTGPPVPSRRTATIVVIVTVVLIVGAGVLALAWPASDVELVAADDVDAAAARTCNGHEELCERRFDEVAYAASHNAMSVAGEPGWFLAEQLDPIPTQLDQGVRALLVDVWSGAPAGDVVRTSPRSYAEALAITEEELGPEVVAAAGRLADSVAGVPDGAEARYLCHGLCETGSTPFLDTLAEIRTWMEANPNEVLTLFIEDHVDAGLIAADVEAAGLLPFVHEPVAGDPWPTLAEMIDSGQRLVVMVEEGAGAASAPWLVNGFEHTQDTPYTFPTVESFSCSANRGPADAPLFLLNHWLSGFTSLVTNAQVVNNSDVLLDRARQCSDSRSQISNFVAVNFVAIGDLYSVVDELNGVT